MTKCKTCGQEIKVEKTIQKIPAKTLIWGKISDKKLTWDEAKEWCKQQGAGVRVASLFSGCGGGDLGLRGDFSFLGKYYPALGFDLVWANELEPIAAETYGKNVGKEIVVGDIIKIKSNEVPDHDLLVGGFPCQSFSMVGRRRGFNDPRGQLYLEMVRILKAKKPAAFIAENVKGLVSIHGGEALRIIKRDFEKVGYKVSYKVLNASHYGVPQKRERVFIIGTRLDKSLPEFSFPEAPYTIVPLGKVIEPHASVEKKYYFSARALAGLRKANKAFNKGRAQFLDRPCNTVSTHLAKVSLNGTDPVLLVTKNVYRRLTPREAARVQSFPEDFEFSGTDGKKYIQIGNAIPPVLMWNVAKEVMSQIFNDGHILKKETERDNVSHSVKKHSAGKGSVLIPA